MRLRAVPRAVPALLRLLAWAAAVCMAAPAGAQPQRAWMGVYVVDLSGFDLKSGTYDADFYLWVRWSGPRDPTGFEVMNGTGTCELGLRRDQGPEHYAVYRCQQHFHRGFDLSDYPLDAHELTIEVEDKVFTRAELEYLPDRAETGMDSAVSLPGWRIGTPRLRVRTHTYTSLGDPAVPRGERAPYSRLVLAVPVHHEGASLYVKSFLVMFLSVGVGLLGSALSCRHVEARLGLGVASIFGVVSSYVVVSQSLPETAQFTLADRLHLVGMGFVFLSVLVSVIVFRLCGRVGDERAERIDRALGIATATGFVAAVLLVTLVR
jgi:hypothetical protein